MKPVVLASALAALAFFWLGAAKYATFHSGSDTGLFVQAIASGPLLNNTSEGGSHYLVHFSPILVSLVPVLAVTHSALALIAVSAIAGALAAPALYLLARKRLQRRTAIGVALIALLYPPLVGVTFADFHENVFVAPLTLWLLWAIDAQRWLPATVLAVATLAVKEDQAIIIGFAALCGFVWFRRAGDLTRSTFCAAAAGLSLLAVASYFGVVRPLAGGGAWSPAHFYDWHRPIPQNQIAPLLSAGKLTYALEAFGPLLFVSFLSPLVVLALPGFAEVFLSHESMTYTMGQHYAAVWIPYVLAAFVFGLASIGRVRPARAMTLVVFCLAACLLILGFASPTHWRHNLGLPSTHDRLLERYLAALPPQLEVGTQEEAFAHLGFDSHASLGIERRPRYVLLDRTFAGSALVVQDGSRMEREVAAGDYRIADRHDGITLYQRVRP